MARICAPPVPDLYFNWNKAYRTHQHDHIVSHRYIKAKKFFASYEKELCEPSIYLLLDWEYGRIWEREHAKFIEARKASEMKTFIKPDVMFNHKRFKRPIPVAPKDLWKMKRFKGIEARTDHKGMLPKEMRATGHQAATNKSEDQSDANEFETELNTMCA